MAVIESCRRQVVSRADAEEPHMVAPDKIVILFLGSNPRDLEALDLTGEFDRLESRLGPSYSIRSRWGVPASQLPDLLHEYAPTILHFSGHGTGSGELFFVDEHRHAYAPNPDAVARVFAQHHGRVRCVVLNACFSESQAKRIAEHVDVVIGISDEILDSNAQLFTDAFYQAISRGFSIEAAFEKAKLKLELGPEGSEDGLRLLRGSGPPPNEIILAPKVVPAAELSIPVTAHRYERTAVWSNALAPRPNDRDQVARERLREGFRRMRNNAATLASAIDRELPEMAHDDIHLDELWELVELIGGDSLALSPCEAFVLGAALLTRQLGMTAVALPGGRDKLREETRWHDAIAQLMRRKGLDSKPGAPPPEDVAEEADRLVLASLQADRAAALPKRADFIDDAGLRESFARLIAKLASCHGWPMPRFRDEFETKLGPPNWCPPSWTLDPLRVACLLRAAQVAHVDDRRAPSWARMQQPVREGELLGFSAAAPFTSDEAPSWWIAVDALRAIDAELRTLDTLLQVTQRERLAARRVAAVDDLRALQSQIPVEGWEPVDTRVRINDIPALIERLGGRALYGNAPDAPLRELLQNAADAVRARRAHEARPSTWGRILVTRGQDERGPWLEVRDNGIGMSRALLIGPLLEFGTSYWDSDLSCTEFPGLHAAGYRSVGEFGIGFFSVFMWGPKVRVTTRSCRDAQTRVLEFEQGLRAPPLLREARSDEHLVDGGTVVRVWLADVEPSAFVVAGLAASDLASKCEWLCPTLDVDLEVQEPDEAEPTRVIVAGDWLTLAPALFLQRLVGGQGLHDDDDEFERVLALLEPVVDPESGQVVGRACVRPPWLRDSAATLVTRGLRLGSSRAEAPTLGVFEGSTTKAARDEGRLAVRPELLQRFYKAQEAKIAQTFTGSGGFEFARVLAPVMNQAITQLPVLWGHRGWTLAQLAAHGGLPPVIILASVEVFTDMKAVIMRESRWEPPPADLPDHVFMLCSDMWIDLDHLDRNPTLVALLAAIARAWQTHPTDMLRCSLLTCIADETRHPAIPSDQVWGAHLQVLRQPGSNQETLASALRGFYEFVAKRPTAMLPTYARMSAAGQAINQLAHAKKRQRKE